MVKVSPEEEETYRRFADKELRTLTMRFDQHLIDEQIHWKLLLEATERNTASIAAMAEATDGLVAAWTTTTNLGKFIKWASSFAIVVVAIKWLVSHIGTLIP